MCEPTTRPKSAPDEPARKQGKLFGKYRGVVTNNFDLEFRGRIMAYVPHLPGSLLNWALPCSPYAGPGVGFWAIPPIGANVWIEFEGGDPSHPIWSGGFWNIGEFLTPMEYNPVAPQLVGLWKTEFATLALNDTPAVGGVTLKVGIPAVALPITMTFLSDGATINIGPSTLKLTAEGITLDSVEIGSTAAASISNTAGASFSVKAGADASTEAAGAVGMKAGGDASVEAAGAASLKAGGDVAVQGGGSAQMAAGGTAAVKAGASAQLVGGTDVTVSTLGALTLDGLGVTVSGASVNFVPG